MSKGGDDQPQGAPRPARCDAGSLLAVAGALLAVPQAATAQTAPHPAGTDDPPSDRKAEPAHASIPEPAFAKDAPAPAEPAGYSDRLISDGKLAPDTSRSDEPAHNRSGRIRSIVAELGGTLISPRTRINGVTSNGSDQVQREVGLSLSGRYQTDNWGMLGIDSELWRGTAGRSGTNSSRRLQGTLALSDRRLALGRGWLADTTLGTLSAPVLTLMSQQPRFYTPSLPLLGGGVVLNRYRALTPSDADENPKPVSTVNLAIGQPGLFGGLRLGNFTGLGGLAISAGAQSELSGRLTAAFQGIAVENTRDPYGVVFGTGDGTTAVPRVTSRGGIASIAWRAPGWRLQANAIVSSVRSTGGSASFIASSGLAAGAWIDGSHRSGRTTQTAGFYYFAPDLAWGNAAVINNVWGGYYRYSTSSQRWRWTGTIDAVRSVNRRGTDGALATADVRRQLTFTTDVGVNAALRASQGRVTAQALGYVDFSTRFGTTRAEAGWSHVPTYDLYRVAWNQTWSLPPSLPAGARLTTQIAFDHRRESELVATTTASAGSAHSHSNAVSIGVNAGANPFAGVGFDASLVYSTSATALSSSVYGPVDAGGGVLSMLSTQSGRTLTANVTASARLSSKWTAIASFISTRSNTLNRYGLTDPSQSPIGTLPGDYDSRQKTSFRLVAGYLTLRYSMSAGSAHQTNGLRHYPFSGTGELVGRVFLDANGNHRRDPGEKGAADILVYMDGLYAVRTDENGYYRFDSVAEGPHRITLNADALPLPWSIAAPEGAGTQGTYLKTVDVGVRRTTELDIAAERE